jgi:sugar lactone lactonase YvrE
MSSNVLPRATLRTNVLLLSIVLGLVACGGGGGGGSDTVGGATGGSAPPPPQPVVGLSLLAGSLGGPGNLDGKDGRFNVISGLAVTPSGTLLVTDESGLRSVDPATGTVNTLNAFPEGAFPYLIEVDAAGNRYDMTGWAIYKTSPSGVRTLLAGSDKQTYDSKDGVGALASFSGIRDMTIDGAGNLFVIDRSSIRKIDPSGTVTTLAGGNGLYATDGTGLGASFRFPVKLAADRTGNVFVLDAGNSVSPALVRKVTPGGTVTTLALKAADSAVPLDVWGDYDGAFAIDDGGNMVVAEVQRGCRLRRVTPDGTVTTLAGTASVYGNGNIDGKGDAARFCTVPGGPLETMASDKSGNLYLYDTANYTLRRITPAGEVTTVAGRAPKSGNEDGTGSAANFFASRPTLRLPTNYYPIWIPVFALTTDAQGNVFVGQGNRVRKVTSTGVVTTLAPGAGASGSAYYYPGGQAYGGDALMVSDNVISRVDATGAVKFIAGQPGIEKGAVDGTGAGASFGAPHDLIVDGLGNIYLHDVVYKDGQPWFGKVVERRISPEGIVTTLPASTSEAAIVTWHADKDGIVWAASRDGAVTKIAPDGKRTPVLAASDRYPTAISRDAAGNLYLAVVESARPLDARGTWTTVRKIAPDGTQTVIAGTAGSSGVRLGAPGSLGRVYAMTAGADGLLYLVTEFAVLRLRQ